MESKAGICWIYYYGPWAWRKALKTGIEYYRLNRRENYTRRQCFGACLIGLGLSLIEWPVKIEFDLSGRRFWEEEFHLRSKVLGQET